MADVELPDGRHLQHRLIRTPPGAGCVVIRDGHAQLWRHRFITGSQGWEIPIDKIEPGAAPATAAARETEEETGWRPRPPGVPALRRAQSRPLHTSTLRLPADGAEQIGHLEGDFESDSVSWVPLASVPPSSATARSHEARHWPPCSWYSPRGPK